MASAVLDSSALLAVMNTEPGADAVIAAMADAVISTVNVAEVVSKLVERGATLDHVRTSLRAFDLMIADFDLPLAEAAGELRRNTRRAGLSIGDRACLALARREAAPALTTDRAWAGLDLGIEIRVIR
jgi:PIN domain nuclease of toxin-antitoxin system